MVKLNKSFFAGGFVFLLVLTFIGIGIAEFTGTPAYHDAESVSIEIGGEDYISCITGSHD